MNQRTSTLCVCMILLITCITANGCWQKPKEPEKPIIQETITEKPELVISEKGDIILPSQEILQTNGKNVFLIGKCENGVVQIVKKNTWNSEERKIWEYQNYHDSQFLLALDCSHDGRRFAYFSQKGLMIMNQDDGVETILEEAPKPTVKSEKEAIYSYYINDIQWSYNNQYLALQYIGFESSAVFIYDTLNQQKLTPIGAGVLSGWRLHWSPVENRYLDPSNDFAYGEPGFYFSEKGKVDQYADISSNLGLKGFLFYKAIFSPNGKQVAFIRSAENVENEFGMVDENKKILMMYDLESKQLTEIVQGELADVIWYSIDGNTLFFITKDTGKTKIMSYDILEQKIQQNATIMSGFMDIRNVLWMGENHVGIEMVEWKSDHSFRNTRIICLDLKNQKISYASPIYPFEIKLLTNANISVDY